MIRSSALGAGMIRFHAMVVRLDGIGHNLLSLGGFVLSKLFSASEKGILLDPSTAGTLYQTTAMQIPCVPGDPVGMVLDQSQWGGTKLNASGATTAEKLAPVLGPELTGVFSANGDVTVVAGAGFTSVSNPTAGTWFGNYAGSGAAIEAGKFYLVKGRVRNTAGRTGEVRITANAEVIVTGLGAPVGVWTPFSTTYLAVGNHTVRAFSNGFAADFDVELSVREVPGNHATQATAAKRPTYGIHPFGGRRNLLTQTDTMATQSAAVTAVAHTISFKGTGSVTLSGASTAGPLVGTGAADRVSLTFTPAAGSLTMTVSGSVTGAQLEAGATVTPYQKVVTQYEVTEAGVPSVHYLSFDGVDDALATPAINFTATDEMTVFAGVRKLSDAAVGMIAETDTIDGSFSIYGPASASGQADFVARSRGTVAVFANTPDSFPAPVSAVLTMLSDISGDTLTMKVNGIQEAASTADQGLGNFGNYPLYIGARAGTSLFFKGNVYGLTVRGKTTIPADIDKAETAMAKLTGITLAAAAVAAFSPAFSPAFA